MRRNQAVAALLLGGLGVAPLTLPRASGHDGHLEYKWREPGDGGDVSGKSVRIEARATFEDTVDRWLVEVLAPEEDETLPDFGPVCEGAGNGDRTVEIVCDWDTTAYSDGKLSWNDRYRLKVTVWNRGDQPADEEDGEGESPKGNEPGGEDSADQPPAAPPPGREAHPGPERLVTVVNPPTQPRGVSLAYAEVRNEVTVSWDPNPEPDVAGYLVEERFADGDWALVAKPTGTTWTGKPAKKGNYRYRVAAVRYVGSSERLVEGRRREPQSGPRKIDADPDAGSKKEDSNGGNGGSSSKTSSSTTSTTTPRAAEDRRRAEDDDDGASGRRQGGKRDNDGRQRAGGATTPAGGGSSTTTTSEPVGSITVTYDGAAPGEPGFPSPLPAPAEAPRPQPRPVVSPIQPGTPGSVQTRYADPAPLPAPVTPEEAYDPGFALTLPYPSEVRLEIEPPPPPPRLLGTVALFRSGEEQRRALLGVAAGGLLTVIVSLQIIFVTRRPDRLVDLAATSDWD